MIFGIDAALLYKHCADVLFGYYDSSLRRIVDKPQGPHELYEYYHDPKTGNLKVVVECRTDANGVLTVIVHRPPDPKPSDGAI